MHIHTHCTHVFVQVPTGNTLSLAAGWTWGAKSFSSLATVQQQDSFSPLHFPSLTEQRIYFTQQGSHIHSQLASKIRYS